MWRDVPPAGWYQREKANNQLNPILGRYNNLANPNPNPNIIIILAPERYSTTTTSPTH